MYSQDDFLYILDNMIPAEIQEAMQDDLLKLERENFSFIEFSNLQERARVLTIKSKISSTHNWEKATCVDSRGHRSNIYWCQKCNMRCSAFDHINKLSIISKVTDNLPTYTVHNQYLMLTCDKAKDLDMPKTMLHCFDCGVSEKGQTSNCKMAEC